MAQDSVLYPPPPACVPSNLTRPGLRYRLRLVAVLAALLLFLAFYFALVLVSLTVLIAAILPTLFVAMPVPESMAAQIGVVVLRLGICLAAGMFFAYLVKGFLTRQPDDRSSWLEIAAVDQPELFAFVGRLCREIGCEPPSRVYLNHEANAAVYYPTSIASLIVPPPKDLLIGLGLVNLLDLVEFKALLAHELGHCTQRELGLSSYVQRLYQVLYNMVYGRDRWDAWMVRAFDTPVVSAFLVPLYMLVEGTRTLFGALFRLLQRAHGGLSWQMEYNADLVATSAAGSDAVIRLERDGSRAQAALRLAAQDLVLAAERSLYTRDLFYHQRQSLPRLPAELAAPASASHPASADRVRNVQAFAVPSPTDDRPAWLLFCDTAALCEEVTRGFYWVCLRSDPEKLAEPEHVQAVLDEERSAITIDARYRGAYDGRLLELGDVEELIAAAQQTARPAPAEQLRQLHGLYSDELAERVAQRRQHADEHAMLLSHSTGGPNAGKPLTFRDRRYAASDAGSLLARVQEDFEASRAYFAHFDRTVFTLHAPLAEDLGRWEEYRQRYRVQAALEQITDRLGEAVERLTGVLRFLYSGQRWRVDQLGGLLMEVSTAVDRLDDAYALAEVVCMPALSNVPAGASLSRLLPPRPNTAAAATAEAAMAGAPLAVLHADMEKIADRLARIRAKSLTGVLAMQEDMVRDWSAQQQPATAEQAAD